MRGERKRKKRHTIFCPPGPLPFRNDSSISSSGGGLGRGGKFVFLLSKGEEKRLNGRNGMAGAIRRPTPTWGGSGRSGRGGIRRSRSSMVVVSN